MGNCNQCIIQNISFKKECKSVMVGVIVFSDRAILLQSNAWNVPRFAHSSQCSVSMHESGLSLWGRVEKMLLCGPNAAPFPLDLLPPEGKCFPCGGAFAIYQPLYGHCSSLPKFFFFFLPLDCLFSKNAFSHFPFTSTCWSSPLVPQRWNDTGVSGVFSAKIPFVLNACYGNKAAASLGSTLGDRLSDIIHQICACIWEEDEARRGRSALISQFWGSH